MDAYFTGSRAGSAPHFRRFLVWFGHTLLLAAACPFVLIAAWYWIARLAGHVGPQDFQIVFATLANVAPEGAETLARTINFWVVGIAVTVASWRVLSSRPVQAGCARLGASIGPVIQRAAWQFWRPGASSVVNRLWQIVWVGVAFVLVAFMFSLLPPNTPAQTQTWASVADPEQVSVPRASIIFADGHVVGGPVRLTRSNDAWHLHFGSTQSESSQ